VKQLAAILLAILYTIIAAGQSKPVVAGQSTSFSVSGWWNSPSAPFSPVVEQSDAITFRVKAPAASKVALLFGEWNVRPQAMTKDTGGVWSITIPPVEPGIYSYKFQMDGNDAVDLHNPVVKSGTEVYGSIVEVPGRTPRFDEIRDVPHGALTTLRYFSKTLNRTRAVVVYTPPQYDRRRDERFPVLYLRHGGGDNETSWTQPAGRADVILENLLAEKKAVPMLIVMSNGLVDGTWASGSTKEGMEKLEHELTDEVMPLVEKTFRTKNDRLSRAITGLSMGGGQAYVMGLRNIGRFAWIGEFSSGLLSDGGFDINERAPGIFNDSVRINTALRLLWIGCGKDDPRFPGHSKLADGLSQKGIHHVVYNVPGGHEWLVWRQELERFMQYLFK
jgi:enterochelin esterase family protein